MRQGTIDGGSGCTKRQRTGGWKNRGWGVLDLKRGPGGVLVSKSASSNMQNSMYVVVG